MQLMVVEPHASRFPTTAPTYRVAGLSSDFFLCEAVAEFGLGVGGRMRQKIYPDDYGIDTWDQSTARTVHVHLVSARDWRTLTGEEPPASPIPIEIYNKLGLPWFELADEELEVLPSSPPLEFIKPVEF